MTGVAPASAPNSYAFTVDTVPPIVTITGQPVSPTNVNAPKYSWTFDKAGTTFTCALNFTGTTPSPSQCGTAGTTITYPAQPDGTYTFTLTGTDPAGNSTTVTASTVIDTGDEFRVRLDDGS